MQCRLAKNLKHVDSDQSATSSRISYESLSTELTRSTSTKHLSGTKQKSSITSALPSPLVHAVIDAIQLRLNESVSNSESDHFRLDSTTPHGTHSGLASSDRDNLASVKTRRRGAVGYRGSSSEIQRVTDSLKTSLQTVPSHWSVGQSDRRRTAARLKL